MTMDDYSPQKQYSPQEQALYEQRLRKALDNANNTSLLDCVEQMATNSQANGTQVAYKGAQNR